MGLSRSGHLSSAGRVIRDEKRGKKISGLIRREDRSSDTEDVIRDDLMLVFSRRPSVWNKIQKLHQYHLASTRKDDVQKLPRSLRSSLGPVQVQRKQAMKEAKKAELADAAYSELELADRQASAVLSAAFHLIGGTSKVMAWAEAEMMKKDLPSIPFVLNILEDVEARERVVDFPNTKCCQIVLPDYEDEDPDPPPPASTGWWGSASTAEVEGRSTSSVQAETEALVKIRGRKSDVDFDKQPLPLAAAVPVGFMENDSAILKKTKARGFTEDEALGNPQEKDIMKANRKICENGCGVESPDPLLQECKHMKFFAGSVLDVGLGGKQDATAIPTAERIAIQRACKRIPDQYEFVTLQQPWQDVTSKKFYNPGVPFIVVDDVSKKCGEAPTIKAAVLLGLQADGKNLEFSVKLDEREQVDLPISHVASLGQHPVLQIISTRNLGSLVVSEKMEDGVSEKVSRTIMTGMFFTVYAERPPEEDEGMSADEGNGKRKLPQVKYLDPDDSTNGLYHLFETYVMCLVDIKRSISFL